MADTCHRLALVEVRWTVDSTVMLRDAYYGSTYAQPLLQIVPGWAVSTNSRTCAAHIPGALALVGPQRCAGTALNGNGTGIGSSLGARVGQAGSGRSALRLPLPKRFAMLLLARPSRVRACPAGDQA